MRNNLVLTTTPVLQPLHYFLLAFIAMAGLSYINFLPGVVNALAGGIGFSEVDAGQIVAANGYGGLVGSTVAIFLVRGIRWPPAMLLCLTLLALMDSASVWVDDYSIMLGWRFFAGVSGGLSLGIAFSVLARLDNPDRAFGALLFVQFSIGSLVMYLLPWLEQRLDAFAVFYVMATITVLGVVFMLCLPALALNNGSSCRTQPSSGVSKSWPYQAAFLLLSAILAYQIAASAIWAYVGLIGLRAGIDSENVNIYIATTGLSGLLGALLPLVSHRRFGRLKWLIAGALCSFIAALLLHFSKQPLLYVIAMTLLFFSWPAVQSYLFAVTATMDSSGRLSTIAAVISAVGLATGPLLAASLLDQGNFSMMLNGCAIVFLISCCLLLKPVQAQEKVEDAKGAMQTQS
jgi:predicted MFS family arabinose efflux permease